MIVLDTAKNYAIGILFATTVLGGLASYVEHQRAERYQASVDPLKQAVKDTDKINTTLRTALQQCEGEKLRLRKANEKAVEEAGKAGEEARLANEAYQHLLANPPLSCAAVLDQEVCPELANF